MSERWLQALCPNKIKALNVLFSSSSSTSFGIIVSPCLDSVTPKITDMFISSLQSLVHICVIVSCDIKINL